ncbi:phospho-N-acetylmuramoyl-pentapeptide-transferase [Marvinbryantia formatexigens DSM 14469]|uniref:Phospho-N-acetylmuramoyl-pentapeptide-transferase n=1 Tax=Marvinbryantia formatexigens DSM 14469 TaxID=478749 RepID=C6LH05_9FIRM|nr:phospho-N-acetylmuramoyl-pentapeptide-transferase [Marvinbryantia formatexigens]EET60064.1 phospho-N-acetylmuramoyl-pentapeptide-transferase [Marvinbryantia formatexigens DSM 14469]SDG50712.1 Phospho-N-acetylmuramoyl-pentapeptide-transferase [Marvinbryantia formatexigens]
MISMEVVLSLLISFAISVILSPFVIPFLRKLKVGNTERTDGVQSHLKKSGTPTMGGLIILISVLVTSLLFIGRYPRIIPILFLTLGFGIIGFLDDYLKVVLRRSDGLLPKQKFLLQIVVTTIFVIYILVVDPDCLLIMLPFTGGMYFDCVWVTVPLVYLVVLGTVNGVNFTDGLDGLATGVTTMVAVFFTVVSIGTKAGIEPITAAVCGALLGFLLFNSHPAQVFMGDTGSLALGGFVAGCAYVLQIPILIPVFGFIYMIEVISVIIQVLYFKKTGGKRFFKMAPIHHHFELCGWSETQIVSAFTVITALLCVISLCGLQV